MPITVASGEQRGDGGRQVSEAHWKVSLAEAMNLTFRGRPEINLGLPYAHTYMFTHTTCTYIHPHTPTHTNTHMLAQKLYPKLFKANRNTKTES